MLADAVSARGRVSESGSSLVAGCTGALTVSVTKSLFGEGIGGIRTHATRS